MTVPLRQGMKIGSYIMRQRLAHDSPMGFGRSNHSPIDSRSWVRMPAWSGSMIPKPRTSARPRSRSVE